MHTCPTKSIFIAWDFLEENMNGVSALDGFINQNNISMQLSRVGKKAPAVVEPREVDRYKCQIMRPGKRINVYVEAPPEEGRLTPSDVIFMLILDASGCEMLKDYYGRHEEMPFAGTDGNRSEFDEFWKEYRARYHQSKKFRAFLGKNLYNELIVRFGFQE
jgi:hypothetical protein